MKRTLAGFALLILLAAGSAAVCAAVEAPCSSIAAELEEAAALAQTGDLPAALLSAGKARLLWQQRRSLLALFSVHGSLEPVDSGFSRLAFYGSAGDGLSFGALCLELACRLEALGEGQQLHWQNLL